MRDVVPSVGGRCGVPRWRVASTGHIVINGEILGVGVGRAVAWNADCRRVRYAVCVEQLHAECWHLPVFAWDMQSSRPACKHRPA